MDYVFGNITGDKVGKKYLQGGTVSYISAAMGILGAKVTAYSHGPVNSDRFPYFKYLTDLGIEAVSLTSSGSEEFTKRFTEFENIYLDGRRRQLCLFNQKEITLDDFQIAGIELPRNSICMLASVMGEITPELVIELKNRSNILIGLGQGELRQIDEQTREVQPFSPVEFLFMAALYDTLIYSEEDVRGMDRNYTKKLEELPKTTIVTKGEKGFSLFVSKNDKREKIDVPAYSLTEEENFQIRGREGAVLTGLGDVFAGAYAFMRGEGNDIYRSAVKANIIASLRIRKAISMEGGIQACPSVREIRKILNDEPGRLEAYVQSIEGIAWSTQGVKGLLEEWTGKSRASKETAHDIF